MHHSALKILHRGCWLHVLDELPPCKVATPRGLQVCSEASVYRQVDIKWTRPPLKWVLTIFRVIHERPGLAAHIQHVSMVFSKIRVSSSSTGR